MPHEKQSFLISQLTDDLTWIFNLNLHLLFINFSQLHLQSLYYEVIELDIISKSGNIDEVRSSHIQVCCVPIRSQHTEKLTNNKATNFLTYLDMRISWVLAGRRENGGWGWRLVKLIMYGMRFFLYNKQIFLASRSRRLHQTLIPTWDSLGRERPWSLKTKLKWI